MRGFSTITDKLLPVARYVGDNPTTVLDVARHAAFRRVAIPLDLLRWLADAKLKGRKAPKDVRISARPPALLVEATFSMKGTAIRVGVAIHFEELEIGPEVLKISFRLRDLDLKVLEGEDSPLGKMIGSGTLDLSKPAAFVPLLGKRPRALVSAKDDHFVVDLMHVPKIGNDKRLRKVLEAITPLFDIASVFTVGDMLVFRLRATPAGARQTALTVREWLAARIAQARQS